MVGEDGTIEKRPVTSGARDANVVAITGGVQPGEKVVTLTNMPLKSGQKVRPETAHQP